ncbi:MAG: hypothetical protein ACLSHL_09935 [Alistipes communis]
MLNRTPQLVIGNRGWQNRSGADDGTGRCTQPVPVFTNQSSVTLTLNGRKVGTKRPGRGGVAMPRRSLCGRREPPRGSGLGRSPMS